MSKFFASRSNWTPTAVADGSNFTDGGYMAIQGGSATQTIRVSEIYGGGLATSQAPMDMIIAVDGTVGATLSGSITNMQEIGATSLGASAPLAFSSSTTKPSRAANLVYLRPAFNAYGGIFRWTALDPDHRLRLYGNASNSGELSMSAGAASTVGAMDSHIVYEPS